MEREIPINLRLSRVFSNVEGDYISIQIQDKLSNSHFTEVKLSLSEFANMLTNRSVEGRATVRALDIVGKKREMDSISFVMPENCNFRDKEVAAEIAKRECPEGWTPDISFISRDSFYTKDGKQYAKTTIRRWVKE